jgi:hypothetical protein
MGYRQVGFWDNTDLPGSAGQVRHWVPNGHHGGTHRCLQMTQAVWKRFSSPTQPGAMGLDATV